MSKFSAALKNLGFKSNSAKNISTSEIHQAVLTNLYLAGYFKELPIWRAINLISFNKEGKKTTHPWSKNPQMSFLSMRDALSKSGAFQDNPQAFKPKYLLKNLFCESTFDIEDIEDFIVYLTCQNAFGRLENQERNEIESQDWMKIYNQQYLENASKIGLINEETPAFLKYDESWIMGSGRYASIRRVKHLKEIADSGIDVGEIRILSGNRELWVEIDNIGDVVEAKDFMMKLAKKNNIRFNENQPFASRIVGGKTRTYLNYHQRETKKLTETLLMKDIYLDVFGSEIHSIIDDEVENYRPTTESTVKNITKNIFKNRLRSEGDLKNKAEIIIMIVSNQPYSKRQKLTIKRVVDKIIDRKISKKIIFDEVGKSAEDSPITYIHSEFAALMSEQFWQYIKKTAHLKKRKRLPHKMIFSTRYKNIDFIPPIPN